MSESVLIFFQVLQLTYIFLNNKKITPDRGYFISITNLENFKNYFPSKGKLPCEIHYIIPYRNGQGKEGVIYLPYMLLSKKKKYLQISLNSTLEDARTIIENLPVNDRIILEAGTPLIKRYGIEGIRYIHNEYFQKIKFAFSPYIVADLKTMDRSHTEINLAKLAGASAAICLGQAPIEVLNSFIARCKEENIDSMVDMMNIEHPIAVLRKLQKPPDVVLLHRGVDEETYNKNKPIPYVQIHKILSSYSVFISLAGADSIHEVRRAVFNGAHIVVVWKNFYRSSSNTSQLAHDFLKEIK